MIHVTNYHPCMFNSNFLKHNHDHRMIIYYLFSIIEVKKNEGKELLACKTIYLLGNMDSYTNKLSLLLSSYYVA